MAQLLQKQEKENFQPSEVFLIWPAHRFSNIYDAQGSGKKSCFHRDAHFYALVTTHDSFFAFRGFVSLVLYR